MRLKSVRVIKIIFTLSLIDMCAYANAQIPIQQSVEIQKWQEDHIKAQRQQQIEQQQNRQRTTNSASEFMPNVTKVDQADDVACQMISQVVITNGRTSPNNQVSRLTYQLQTHANQYLATHKNCLSIANIIELQNQLASILIELGYLTTHIVVPNQNLKEGTLHLELQIGTLSAIQVQGQTIGNPKWLMLGWQDNIYNQRDADQALENLKRLPSQVSAQIELTASEKPNGSNLTYKFPQLIFKDRINGVISIDNSGTYGSGHYQANASLSIDSPLGLYDSLTINAGSNINFEQVNRYNNRNYGIYWDVPIGYNSLQLSTTQSTYLRTQAGYGRNVKIKGETTESAMTLERVLYRNSNYIQTLSLKFADTRNHVYFDGHDLDVERRNYLYTHWNWGHRYYRDSAQYSVYMGYKSNLLKYTDNGEHQWHNKFNLWNLALSAYVPFQIGRAQWHYSGTLKAQYAESDLPASEMFSIGNRYSVRGTDETYSLMSENGATLRNEWAYHWRHNTQSTTQIYSTLDWGVVHGQAVPYANAGLTGRSLVGSSLGVRGQYHTVGYDLAVGYTLHKPKELIQRGPSITGSLSWQF